MLSEIVDICKIIHYSKSTVSANGLNRRFSNYEHWRARLTSTSNAYNEKIFISLLKWKFLFISVDIKYMIIVPYYCQKISDLLTSILIKLADNGRSLSARAAEPVLAITLTIFAICVCQARVEFPGRVASENKYAGGKEFDTSGRGNRGFAGD